MCSASIMGRAMSSTGIKFSDLRSLATATSTVNCSTMALASDAVGTGVGTGVGDGVGRGVGAGVGRGVGTGEGTGVGMREGYLRTASTATVVVLT